MSNIQKGSTPCKQRAEPIKSIDAQTVFNYLMMLATRPEDTVLSPSRYQTGVLRCANGDFSYNLWGKIQILRCVRVIFGDFVIMVLSYHAIRKTKYLLSHNFLFS